MKKRTLAAIDWTRTHKLKAAMLLVIVALVILVIVEFAKGAVTPYLLDVLEFVDSLGPWVRLFESNRPELAVVECIVL